MFFICSEFVTVCFFIIMFVSVLQYLYYSFSSFYLKTVVFFISVVLKYLFLYSNIFQFYIQTICCIFIFKYLLQNGFVFDSG